MTLLKIVLVCALAFGGYKYWKERDQPHGVTASGGSPSAPAAADTAASPNGFLPLPPVNGVSNAGVVVFAAKDCPQEDAVRADQLAADLSRNGVPVQQTNDVSFSSSDPGAFKNINAVMSGQLPIVFVNGRGKANPQLSEVMAEYRGRNK